MRAIDATSLALLLHPQAKPPIDPATGVLLTRHTERLELLVSTIQREHDTLVVPTPALAEVLVRLEDSAPAVLDRLNRSARFKIADFDQRAAVELAALTRDALRSGDKFEGSDAPWQKVKLDRQIVAIALVQGASVIYSDDAGLGRFAAARGMTVVKSWDLPLPEDPEPNLFPID